MKNIFPKKNTVFNIKRQCGKWKSSIIATKYKELMQIGGHYVYYEKNAAMQSYMITARKKIGVTPSRSCGR